MLEYCTDFKYFEWIEYSCVFQFFRVKTWEYRTFMKRCMCYSFLIGIRFKRCHLLVIYVVRIFLMSEIFWMVRIFFEWVEYYWLLKYSVTEVNKVGLNWYQLLSWSAFIKRIFYSLRILQFGRIFWICRIFYPLKIFWHIQSIKLCFLEGIAMFGEFC